VLDASPNICSAYLVVLAVYGAVSVAARFLTDAASQSRRMVSFVLDSQYNIIINSSRGLGIEIHGKTDTNFAIYCNCGNAKQCTIPPVTRRLHVSALSSYGGLHQNFTKT
jgi:hypothetical protein